jgi:hypothetical protein
MRIPDRMLKTVGFVSRYDDDGVGGSFIRPRGTAFVVGVQMDEKNVLAHLVTAKHVAKAIEEVDGLVALNGKDGEPLFLRLGSQRWFYHPTEEECVDVAVMPFGSFRFREYDIEWIPQTVFATDSVIAEYDIGLGDELVIIGLFSKFYGHTEVVPLVRTGNIAMMPKDRLPVNGFLPMEAYLAEGRSIGGLSGSPVFVRNTVKMQLQTAGQKPAFWGGLGQSHLLGLMHGHWDLPVSFSDTEKAEAVNMGVSIIVPAKKILETLYHPELVAMREHHWKNPPPEPGSEQPKGSHLLLRPILPTKAQRARKSKTLGGKAIRFLRAVFSIPIARSIS